MNQKYVNLKMLKDRDPSLLIYYYGFPPTNIFFPYQQCRIYPPLTQCQTVSNQKQIVSFEPKIIILVSFER